MKSLLKRFVTWLREEPDIGPRPYQHVKTADLMRAMQHAEACGYKSLYATLYAEYEHRTLTGGPA